MGEIIHIIFDFIGHATNNEAELSTLILGLKVAKRQGCTLLTVEGDSQLIIHHTTRLLCGSSLSRLSANWRLDHLAKQLRDLLTSFSVLQASHVRREANKVADYLANQGVANPNSSIDSPWGAFTTQPTQQHTL